MYNVSLTKMLRKQYEIKMFYLLCLRFEYHFITVLKVKFEQFNYQVASN